MDEFAQTRSPDDLFDDDFTPIDEPVIEEFIQPEPPQSRRGRNDGPRGRGRGRPMQHHQQHNQPTPSKQLSSDTPAHPSAAGVADGPTSTAEASTTEPDTTPRPSTAVRGDRSATGGTTKPKLTEDELSARLAAAKLNNAKREEAHRLAEADEASFHQREAQASQRRQEEGRARRLMDQEREKNRLRKLGAQGVGSGMRGRRISRARTHDGVSIRGEHMVGRQGTKALRLGKRIRNRMRMVASGVEGTRQEVEEAEAGGAKGEEEGDVVASRTEEATLRY